MDWRHRARCVGMDPELFFPIGPSTNTACAEQTAQAKAVCADCPVRTECLAWAMATGQDDGVWGGLSRSERRDLRRRTRPRGERRALISTRPDQPAPGGGDRRCLRAHLSEEPRR